MALPNAHLTASHCRPLQSRSSTLPTATVRPLPGPYAVGNRRLSGDVRVARAGGGGNALVPSYIDCWRTPRRNYDPVERDCFS